MSARLQAASSLTALGAATAAVDSSQSQQLSHHRIRLRLRDSSWCLGDSQWSRSVRGCRTTIVAPGRRGWSPLRIVAGDVGGQNEESFGDVESRMVDFFTFKAVRHILRKGATAGDEEGREEVEWLRRHVEANTRRDSKLFLKNLVQEQRNVAERVMETRLQLFNKWALLLTHSASFFFLSHQTPSAVVASIPLLFLSFFSSPSLSPVPPFPRLPSLPSPTSPQASTAPPLPFPMLRLSPTPYTHLLPFPVYNPPLLSVPYLPPLPRLARSPLLHFPQRYDQEAMEEELRQQNLELLRERLLQTVRFSTDPTLDDDSADAPPPSKQA
ncbi:unnamed protein product [Closterium sp. Naga37s-1]|nr:unnamed protein product [Closterium sp. Naga37s-1]